MSGPSFRDIPPGQKKRGAFALRFCPLFAFLQCPSRTPYCADGRLALRRRSTASRTRAACECNHHVLASGNCSCADGRKQGHGNLTRLDPSRPLPMLLDRHLIKPFSHFLAAEGASVLSALQHGAGQRASKPGPWGSSPKKSKTKKQRVDERLRDSQCGEKEEAQKAEEQDDCDALGDDERHRERQKARDSPVRRFRTRSGYASVSPWMSVGGECCGEVLPPCWDLPKWISFFHHATHAWGRSTSRSHEASCHGSR